MGGTTLFELITHTAIITRYQSMSQDALLTQFSDIGTEEMLAIINSLMKKVSNANVHPLAPHILTSPSRSTVPLQTPAGQRQEQHLCRKQYR